MSVALFWRVFLHNSRYPLILSAGLLSEFVTPVLSRALLYFALLSARSSDSSLLFSLVFFRWNRGATRPILLVQQLELPTHWKRDGQEVGSNLSWSGSSAVLNVSWSGSRAILSPRAIRFGIISVARCSCLISWKAVFPQGSFRSCFSAQRNLLVLKQ